MKRLKKILLILFLIIVLLVFALFLFIKLYKPFGTSPNNEDRKKYESRSSNYKNGEFYNDGNFSVMSEWNDPYKDRTTGKGVEPIDKIPYVKYSYKKLEDRDDVLITWFGHSSVLIQMHNMNILVDPVFENRPSPVSFAGPKRFSDVPVDIADLPNIVVIVITHDHYDHESYKTLISLDNKVTKYIVPLGIEKDLEKFGIKKSKITNMAWWEETEVNGLKIVCTPARHYTGRYLLDKNDTLWSSWLFIDEYNTIFDSGDTGYGTHFKEIQEKYGDVTFGLFDAAQYSESWHEVHMFPEEAVEAATIMNANLSMVIHYGALTLSNHSWDDPVDRFTRYAKEKKINYMSPKIGETVNIKDYKKYQEEWWKEIK